ncbi:MAG TPA: IclR family transcriptional regulator [Mycobacteriales bacterium]|jgi:Transcriptional regulator
MAGNSGEPGRSVTSKVLAILGAFSVTHSELTLAQIARRTALPVPTVHRLARELVAWGGLERLSDGTYRIGLRLWEIGSLAPQQRRIRQVAIPFMEDLYEATHGNVQLAVREGTEALYIEKISGRYAVPIVSRVGGRLPLHATGVGKVLLAFAPQEVIDEVLTAGLARLTPKTIVMPGKLLRALADVRRTGLAFCYEEMTLGSVSVATPVHGPDRSVIAALSIVVHSFPADAQRFAPAVRTAGLGISRQLARLDACTPETFVRQAAR